MRGSIFNKIVLLVMSLMLLNCGGVNLGNSANSARSSAGSSGNIFGGNQSKSKQAEPQPAQGTRRSERPDLTLTTNAVERRRGSDAPLDISGLLNPDNDDQDIRVNKYLWEASLQTLDFLPLEAADPFSGILVFGWGTAPGSRSQFRGTILIQDPALEAGSLKVAMQRRGGPANVETNRRIEDAILTRARQLRIGDARRRRR